MQKPDCIFCRIAAGELGSAKVWENNEFLAILDVSPNTPGMTLVLPKQHHDSYIYDLEPARYAAFFEAARTVSVLLEKGLGVSRVALVAEGLGVNHAHIKLYPLHGLEQRFQETWAKDRIFVERYQGYLSTQLGPPVDLAALQTQAKSIVAKAG